jgi:hypothetical protein
MCNAVYCAKFSQLQVAVKLNFHYSKSQNNMWSVAHVRMRGTRLPKDQSAKKATQKGC